ncbi:MAG TPA: dihydrofolate reductase [Xanthobacteraceae bacterium]|nr:dihydrofolate reductase [Xanthobacteraceae bacterium]
MSSVSASPPGRAAAPALVLVAAVADNGIIGREGGLPWRLKSDLKNFRAITMGKPVVMGRKTYLSIGRPLQGRTNIVVSRNSDFAAPGIVVTPSLAAALAIAHGDALRRAADAIAVIGGAELYAATIGNADRLVITRVHLRPEGDTLFPQIDPALWQEVASRDYAPGPDDAAAFTVLVYARRATHFERN